MTIAISRPSYAPGATRSGSTLDVPVPEVPGVAVPAGEVADELVPHRGNIRARDHGNHDLFVHHHLVALDQDTCPLHRIKLERRRPVELVIFLALPARAVAAR